MFDFIKKNKIREPFTEATFECKRGGLTIQEISSYRGPVLIVHGTKDNIVNLEYSRQAQRSYPDAKLHIIEGGAHGFSKKHDAIAIAHLRRFAGRDGK